MRGGGWRGITSGGGASAGGAGMGTCGRCAGGATWGGGGVVGGGRREDSAGSGGWPDRIVGAQASGTKNDTDRTGVRPVGRIGLWRGGRGGGAGPPRPRRAP